MAERCGVCKKKLNMAEAVAGKCKCGNCYCSVHRCSDSHECTYNYKEEGKAHLQHQLVHTYAKKVEAI